MKLIVLVEGETERDAFSPFLRKWLNTRLQRPISVKVRRFKGTQYLSKFAASAKLILQEDATTIVLGLIDRYEWKLPVPPGEVNPHEWGRRHLETKVANTRFRQHVAYHQTEAWLLSDPSIFPEAVRNKLPAKAPEEINLNEPPGKLLHRLYRDHERREYSKRIDGTELFNALSPEIAYRTCPKLRAMLDDILSLAREIQQ